MVSTFPYPGVGIGIGIGIDGFRSGFGRFFLDRVASLYWIPIPTPILTKSSASQTPDDGRHPLDTRFLRGVTNG